MTEIESFWHKIFEGLQEKTTEGMEVAGVLLVIARDRFSAAELDGADFVELVELWFAGLEEAWVDPEALTEWTLPLLRFGYPFARVSKKFLATDPCLTPFEQEIVGRIREHIDAGGPYELSLAAGLMLVHPLPDASDAMHGIIGRLTDRFWKRVRRMGGAVHEMDAKMLGLLRDMHA